MQKRADFLGQVSIFSLMKKDDLDRIAEIAEEHRFGKGGLIIREGDRDKRLFIIISGNVEVVKGLGTGSERQLRIMGPLSYFGEMSLIDDLVRSASVIARDDTELLSVDQGHFREVIAAYPEIAFELLQMLSRRIRVIEKTMLNTLGAILPICAFCKRVRESDGSWTQIESYITDRSETEFSHTICQECKDKLYPPLRNGG
jgi:CRP/FNR family cyclic AMP-dependent transcriptional regulator